MPAAPRPVAALAVLAPWLVALLGPGLSPGCQPKAPPPRLPPAEIPHLGQVQGSTGQRGSVVQDAVQVGSNQARVTYECGRPHGENVDGGAVLNPPITHCEIDTDKKAVTLSDDSKEDCPGFLVAISDYRGPGTYNTSSLGALSFGIAKLRQDKCGWEGNLCLNWSGPAGPHKDTSCTVEINSDGGLQYGTTGATVSGTFVCSAFVSPWKGCAGVSAVAGCAVTRGSFSVAGCTAVSSAPAKDAAPKTAPKKHR